jgi:hypothetical protein
MSFVENMNIFKQSLMDPKDKNFWRNLGITIIVCVVCVVCIYVFISLVASAFKGSPKFKTVKLFFDKTKTECLHIAEIEIKDKDGKIIDLNNHLIELSSQYTGDGVDMTAKKMIDKDPKTIAHTLCGTGESITITFKEPQTISAIKITNRGDGNSARIVGASLSLQPEDASITALTKKIEKDQAVFEFEHKEGVLSLKA